MSCGTMNRGNGETRFDFLSKKAVDQCTLEKSSADDVCEVSLLPKYVNIFVDRRPADGAHMSTTGLLAEVHNSTVYEFAPSDWKGVVTSKVIDQCHCPKTQCCFEKCADVTQGSPANSDREASTSGLCDCFEKCNDSMQGSLANSCRQTSISGHCSCPTMHFVPDTLAPWVPCCDQMSRDDNFACCDRMFRSSVLMGDWNDVSSNDDSTQSGNILGKYGRMSVVNGIATAGELPTFNVPVCPTTHENIAYYGARLLEPGAKFEFLMSGSMAMTEMDVGQKYVDEFIMQDEGATGAGGVYIEYHDLPHLHIPMNADAAGYLVLGKSMDQDYSKIELSAFSIPYGKAVLMGPNVIHNDCFLTGSYRVVYGVTNKCSCVRLFDAASGKKVRLQLRDD